MIVKIIFHIVTANTHDLKVSKGFTPYDCKDNFSYCYYDKEILPAIKVRKTSSINTNCYPRRKSVLAQLYNLDLWKISVRYGDR